MEQTGRRCRILGFLGTECIGSSASVSPFQGGRPFDCSRTQGGAAAGVTAAAALPWARLLLPLRGVRTDESTAAALSQFAPRKTALVSVPIPILEADGSS